MNFSVINNNLLPGNNIPEEKFMPLVDIPKRHGALETKSYSGSYSPSTFSSFKILTTNMASTIISMWTTPKSISAALSYHTNSKSVSQLPPGHFHSDIQTPLQTHQMSDLSPSVLSQFPLKWERCFDIYKDKYKYKVLFFSFRVKDNIVYPGTQAWDFGVLLQIQALTKSRRFFPCEISCICSFLSILNSIPARLMNSKSLSLTLHK